VKEKDKAVSLGFGMMLFSLFVFVPSPIIFGYIIGQLEPKFNGDRLLI
jgi:Organic Anion Transporter Polypeptide (OATP) family